MRRCGAIHLAGAPRLAALPGGHSLRFAGAVLYLVFMVYPFFQSIYFSFTSWNGVTAVKEWVGLANYRELIGDAASGFPWDTT